VPTLKRLLPWSLPLLSALVVVGTLAVAISELRPENILWIDWYAYAFGTDRVLSGE